MEPPSIELVPANSPETKGRIERLSRTLQDRLVKELRLADIGNLSDSNNFSEEVFVPQFNARFTVVPAKNRVMSSTPTPQDRGTLNSIFSLKSTRNDYTVRPNDKVIVEIWLDHPRTYPAR